MPALHRADLPDDPVEQFARWFDAARAEVPLADAMTLATVGPDGSPDARMVLLKGFDSAGFRFFTNYGSAKAAQIEANGRAALILYWRELDRQVRVRGDVRRLPELESDQYFATRPRDSQIGAWASPQSRVLESRAELDAQVREMTERLGVAPVPRPARWGGFLLRPDSIEFWQGQVGRLHDRFRYKRAGGSWRIERLAP